MDMTFLHICCKNCIVCLKKPKINEKEAGDGPFFLKKTTFIKMHLWPGKSRFQRILSSQKGPIPASFLFIFVLFHYNFNVTNRKSIDGLLGILTRGCRMVGSDKSAELWRHPLVEISQGRDILPYSELMHNDWSKLIM